MSLPRVIAAWINRRRRVTSLEVLGRFGRLVDAARARRSYEKKTRNRRRVYGPGKPQKPNLDVGRRNVINEVLRRLAKAGRIAKLGPCLWGPARGGGRATA